MKNLHIFLNGERGVRVAELLVRSGHGIDALIVPVGKRNIVDQLVQEFSLKVKEVDNVNTDVFCNWFEKQKPNLSIISGFSTIFKPRVISIPDKGSINLHTGRLPEYRGGSPLNWQIINGEAEAGISVIEVDEGIDTGPVLSEILLPIGSKDTISSMHNKANALFPKLVLGVVESLENNALVGHKQHSKNACYWHQRQDDDGHLKPAAVTTSEADCFIRALSHPYPGAFGFVKNHKVRLLKAIISDMNIRGAVGRICFIQKQGPYLICKDGALLLQEYVFEDNADRRLRHGEYIQ